MAYVKDYTQKWSDAFEVAAESLAAEKGPQAVVDALKTTDAGKIADDISQGLQDRWNVLGDALANVGGQQPAAADQAAIVGKLRGDADFLKTWKGLYSANTGIRSAVSGLNEADVKAIQKLLTNADTDPASRYWQAMARA